MSDSIFVRGLLIHAHHGVMPHEENVGQRFVIDLELAIDLAPAGRSDKLAIPVRAVKPAHRSSASTLDRP